MPELFENFERVDVPKMREEIARQQEEIDKQKEVLDKQQEVLDKQQEEIDKTWYSVKKKYKLNVNFFHNTILNQQLILNSLVLSNTHPHTHLVKDIHSGCVS